MLHLTEPNAIKAAAPAGIPFGDDLQEVSTSWQAWSDAAVAKTHLNRNVKQ